MCGAGGALPPTPHPPAVGPPGGASSASGTDGTPGFCSGRGLPPLRSSLSQILIRNRATDLDARMHDGTTPLILAARLAVEGMLEDLINSHADVNAVDDLGKPGPQPSGGGGGWGARPPAPPQPRSASPRRQVRPALGRRGQQCGGRRRAAEERGQQGHAEQQGGRPACAPGAPSHPGTLPPGPRRPNRSGPSRSPGPQT